jgi:inward rectifier potassium channel
MPDGEPTPRTSKKHRPALQLNAERARFPQIDALGTKLSFHEDFYHVILRLSWKAFFGFVTLAFGAVNVLFALLYMAVPGSVLHATAFIDHFFFSVETLATIGYGEMSPQNHWAHAIVTLESLAGIASTAMITGLTFVRFARPTARILFSDKMVIFPRDGIPHLMFRMANWRRNQIAEAQLNIFILTSETTQEGETIRRPVRLELVRDKNPLFALSWTAMHCIDASSPFYGDGLDRLREQGAEIFLALTGLDETLMQTITARWRYRLDDIVPNSRFADVIVIREDGVRVIDYDRFHQIVHVATSTQSKPS